MVKVSAQAPVPQTSHSLCALLGLLCSRPPSLAGSAPAAPQFKGLCLLLSLHSTLIQLWNLVPCPRNVQKTKSKTSKQTGRHTKSSTQDLCAKHTLLKVWAKGRVPCASNGKRTLEGIFDIPCLKLSLELKEAKSVKIYALEVSALHQVLLSG